MAGKLKYLEVTVISDAKSLAGYTVLGDITGTNGRTLILKRPDQPSKPRKQRVNSKPAVTAAKSKATDFPPVGSTVGNG